MMRVARLGLSARLALRAYPPSFRDRYGEEIELLSTDLTERRGLAFDLWRGVVRAWLRPSFTGPDRHVARLRASVSTTWVAWCAAFLIAPAMSLALLDEPTPGADHAVHDLLNTATALFGIGWSIALAGAVMLAYSTLLPAVRQRDWAALRPLLIPFGLALVAAGTLLGLVLSRGDSHTSPSGATLALAILFVVEFCAFVISVAICPVLTLRRLKLHVDRLKLPTILAVALAVIATLMTAVSFTAAIRAGHPQIFRSPVLADISLGIAAIASLVALTSSARGLGELRTVRQ
jgi:hypothetical protein